MTAEPPAQARCGEGAQTHSHRESIFPDRLEGARYCSKHSNVLTCLISDETALERWGCFYFHFANDKTRGFLEAAQPGKVQKWTGGQAVGCQTDHSAHHLCPGWGGEAFCGEGCPGGVGAGLDTHTYTHPMWGYTVALAATRSPTVSICLGAHDSASRASLCPSVQWGQCSLAPWITVRTPGEHGSA